MLKIENSRYLGSCLTDRHEIWHDFMMADDRPQSWKPLNSHISATFRPIFTNLARWYTLTLSTPLDRTRYCLQDTLLYAKEPWIGCGCMLAQTGEYDWTVRVCGGDAVFVKLLWPLVIMAAMRNRCEHYIFALWFLLSFFPRLISAVVEWISTYTILLHRESKKGYHPNHDYNFVSSWSICKILSLLQRAVNFQQNRY